jgi:hypothetical protein
MELVEHAARVSRNVALPFTFLVYYADALSISTTLAAGRPPCATAARGFISIT